MMLYASSCERPSKSSASVFFPSSVSNSVLLLHRYPGKLTALFGHLLAELGVLGLELREFIASRLPFLAGSDRVLGHVRLLWRFVDSA